MSRETCVRWLGMNAVYATDERAILAALPVREQAFLHTLKAFTEGELSEKILGTGKGIDQEAGKALALSGEACLQQEEPKVFVDPEDIPFGAGVQTPRKPVTYALVWTWRKHREFPYKSSKFPWKSAEHKKAVWKKWYERQGWKVTSHATGYFARHPSGQSHSISLHEYHKDSHERLR